MKKTLVALAAISAVTGAMADATIYGIMDQAVISTAKTSATGVKTTAKSFGEDLNGFSELGVKGSEDLGDGLTATYGINIALSVTQTNALLTSNAPFIYHGSGVGLKGGFGAVSIGTTYNLNFITNVVADASGFAGASTGQLNSSAGGLKGNILSYTAPQFVPGLSLAAELQRGGATTTAGNMTGYMAQYDTGGLMVRYSTSTKTEAANAVTTTTSLVGTTTTTTYTGSNQMSSASIGGTATAISARTALDKTKATAIAVTYDFGMAKVFYGASTIKSGTTVAQIKTGTTGVSVPFGEINVGYQSSTEKATSDGTGLALSANITSVTMATGRTVESSGNRLFVTYSLSKRTTLYGMSGKSSVDTIAGAASTLKTSTTSIGIKHGF